MSPHRCGFRKVFLAVALVSLATLGMAHQASAINISSHATACNPYGFASTSNLFYTESGVWNNLPTQTGAVICSVPRVPNGSGGGSFAVEGKNYPGQTTTCSVLSFSSVGTFMAAKSFSITGVGYSRWVTFSSIELPPSAYVSVICTLPANRGGYLRGIYSF
jgi:hypothetical protein